MGRIKDRNYYQVSGWMINQLGLSGRELHAYAIIYGFTQDGETEFNGSLNYIMEWLGTSSFHTALRAINALIDKGLITKRQTTIKGVKSNYYKAVLPYPTEINGTAKTAEGVLPKQQRGTAETAEGGTAKTAEGGTAETADNNNSLNNTINNNIDNLLGEPAEKSDPIPYHKIKDLYNSTCTSLAKIVTVSENRKKAIAARWKEYGGQIEVFENLFKMAEASTFLKGGNDRNWTATFDWLMKQANMAKVIEGNYKNKGDFKNANSRGTQGTGTRPGANQTAAGHVPAITTAELEDKLRKEGSFRGYPDFDAMFGKKAAGAE